MIPQFQGYVTERKFRSSGRYLRKLGKVKMLWGADGFTRDNHSLAMKKSGFSSGSTGKTIDILLFTKTIGGCRSKRGT